MVLDHMGAIIFLYKEYLSMVSQDLLNDIQFIDDARVYEVTCREGKKKFKLEVFAENYLEFKSELDKYLDEEPNTQVNNIRAMTPDQYKSACW